MKEQEISKKLGFHGASVTFRIRWCKSALILHAVELTSSSLTCKILVLISSSGVWDEWEKFCTMGNGIWTVEEPVLFGSMFLFLNSQVHSPCHITAFTGLYIIAGCLGKPQCAEDRLSEALIGLALVERYFIRKQIDG